MPKKTRQEKILAQLKRLQQQQSSQASSNEPGVEVPQKLETAVKFNLKSLEVDTLINVAPQKRFSSDYSHVFRDLRKSLIFAAVAIVFEIILSRFS